MKKETGTGETGEEIKASRLGVSFNEPYKNPLSLVLFTAILVFCAEGVVMIILEYMRPLTMLQEAFIDALLLSVISIPILYFVLIIPLKAIIREKEKLEADVHTLKAELSRYRNDPGRNHHKME